MKLYSVAGVFVGTQLAAKELARERGTNWREAEVPTDKPGLIDWLNRHTEVVRQVATNLAAPKVPAVPAPPPAPRAPDMVARDISIEEAIGAADHARAIRLAEHIHCRLMELARAGAA